MKATFIVFAVLAVYAWNVNAVPEVKCPEYQEEGVTYYVPHPCDCNTYFVCLGTEPVPMPCPKGLHWDNKNEICNWPNVAKCRPHRDCPDFI